MRLHVADDFSTQLALVAPSNVLGLVPRLARPEGPTASSSAHDSPAIRAVLSPWVDPDGGLGA